MYYKAKDLAEILGVSEQTIRNLVHNDIIKPLPESSSYYIFDDTAIYSYYRENNKRRLSMCNKRKVVLILSQDYNDFYQSCFRSFAVNSLKACVVECLRKDEINMSQLINDWYIDSILVDDIDCVSSLSWCSRLGIFVKSLYDWDDFREFFIVYSICSTYNNVMNQLSSLQGVQVLRDCLYSCLLQTLNELECYSNIELEHIKISDRKVESDSSSAKITYNTCFCFDRDFCKFRYLGKADFLHESLRKYWGRYDRSIPLFKMYDSVENYIIH